MVRFSVWATAVVAGLLASGAAAQDYGAFQTPSGNIHCVTVSESGGLIDCEIIEKTVVSPLPPKPADCELDYGNRFLLEGSGEATALCYGDSAVNPSSEVLAYGESRQFGGVSCMSSREGLSCINGEGHGIFLSKKRQELY